MKIFTRRQTNIAKGTTILMVLWHHLFYNSQKYQQLFTAIKHIDGVPLACYISMIFKFCLAVFLILSGYGLHQAYQWKGCRTLKETLKFVYNHLLGLLFEYWFIFLIFVPPGFLLGRDPAAVYQHNIGYFLADFFGLAYLFNGSTMNAVWWYMSIIIVYYLLFPLITALIKKWPEAFLAAAAFISVFSGRFRYFDHWLFPFVLGVYFSHRDLINRVSGAVRGAFNRFAAVSVTILGCALLRIELTDAPYVFVFDSFFCTAVIFFCFWILSKIRFLSRVLECFGIYSGMIFMFHPFFYEYYFSRIIYRGKYAPVIFLTLAAVCLVTAFCLDKIKGLIRYNALRDRLKLS